jgi:hypothetical protein
MITLEMLIRRERELTGALSEVQGMIAHIKSENEKKMISEKKPVEEIPKVDVKKKK